MKSIKIMLVGIFLAAIAFVPAVGVNAQPSVQGSLCQGGELVWTGQPGDCTVSSGEATDNVNSFVTLVINIFSWIVGVISVIMIIYGGFKYITSGGDTGNVTTAKNTILYAIIGLIIVALAQLIVRFVLGTVTGQVTP